MGRPVLMLANPVLLVVFAALESLVALVEMFLFRATMVRVVGGVAPQGQMLGQALKLSLAGNLVSILVSRVMPAAIFWLLQ